MSRDCLVSQGEERRPIPKGTRGPWGSLNRWCGIAGEGVVGERRWKDPGRDVPMRFWWYEPAFPAATDASSN